MVRRVGTAFAALGLAITSAVAPSAPVQEGAPDRERGLELYREQCAVCHGVEGKGEGPAAYLLFPKPRDFTRAYFKIRSTRSGSLPTDEDLYRTITRGMPGSAMPSFEWMGEADRRALVGAVKSFSEDFRTLEPEPLPPVVGPPAAEEAALALGAKKYRGLGCAKCHGPRGRGNGPSAAELRDDRDDPIPPNDFTRGIYKGGGDGREIYLRFLSGMDGTPMPSYEGTAAPEEIWALVRYVKSLAGPKIAVQPSSGNIVARRLPSAVPADPSDPAWREVEAFRVPLMLLWQRQHAVDGVEVRAVHDGENLAILLSWEDPTAAWSVWRGQDFADGVAVQFAFEDPPPHFSMGSSGGPVNLWHWRADRELELAERRGLESIYPTAVGDALAGGPEFVTATDAGNPAAAARIASPVQDLNAEGFGSVTPQPARAQNVAGTGVWDSGRWRVVLRRALRSRDRGDVSFSTGETFAVAFAVWDGDGGDRDGQKAVSTWYELEITR